MLYSDILQTMLLKHKGNRWKLKEQKVSTYLKSKGLISKKTILKTHSKNLSLIHSSGKRKLALNK